MSLKINLKLISSSKAVFFDFDGVIKDSIEIKSKAFGELFQEFGPDFVQKVKIHNEENCGVSRFEKIPAYMKWAGIVPDNENLKQYLEEFSSITIQKVINSKWIPGVFSYLKQNNNKQLFFMLTSTTQEDIEIIVSELEIQDFFVSIIGSPINKTDALRQLLDENSIRAIDAVMIGDSYEDYEAAKLNLVPFILKKNIQNKDLQNLNCMMINDFSDE